MYRILSFIAFLLPSAFVFAQSSQVTFGLDAYMPESTIEYLECKPDAHSSCFEPTKEIVEKKTVVLHPREKVTIDRNLFLGVTKVTFNYNGQSTEFEHDDISSSCTIGPYRPGFQSPNTLTLNAAGDGIVCSTELYAALSAK